MKTSVAIILAACIITAGIVFVQLRNGSESVGNNATLTNEGQGNDAEEFELATERTRQTVRMLDDIYKGGIVTITDKYVTEDSEIPAGRAFKQIFAIAKDKGWHEARLLDATGDPYNGQNVAKDEFEKRAIKKMLEGEAFYEEIEEEGTDKYLRVMTPIPVVFDKCTWCHENYEDVPEGQAIGAMGYRIKIDWK
jgi:hypothetical protein